MLTARQTIARLALGLLAAGFAPGWARGQASSTVADGAGMFPADALREARAELSKIDRAHGVAVTVETVETLNGQGVDEFATRRAEMAGREGIFVLIARREHKVEVLASPRSLRDELGASRLLAIRDAFVEEFRKNKVDEGLLAGIRSAAEALSAARPARRAEGASASSRSPLVLRHQVRLTLSGARHAIAGAEAKAIEKGYKMNIAAVDDGGHLLAFARMDGARPASAATATTKAVTAATYRQPTGPIGGPAPDVLLNLSLQNAASASGGKVTTLLGGVPIVVDGQVIGALGVGGGTGEQDAEVARAGVDAFLADLQAGARDPEKHREKGGDGEPRPGEAEARPAAATPAPR